MATKKKIEENGILRVDTMSGCVCVCVKQVKAILCCSNKKKDLLYALLLYGRDEEEMNLRQIYVTFVYMREFFLPFFFF